MKNVNINNESGRSMIEMLGVLAIIGVLSVGGIAGYSKAMNKYRINKTIEQITLIAGNVRTFFGSQKNYRGAICQANTDGRCVDKCYGTSLGCPIIKKAKIFPDEMITVNADGLITSITNPFGFGVELILRDKSANGDNQAFSIGYYIEDNKEACIELLTQDWNNADVSFIFLIGMDDESDRSFAALPANVDDAVEVCSHAVKDGPDGPTEIMFYFDADVNYYKTNAYADNTWYPH